MAAGRDDAVRVGGEHARADGERGAEAFAKAGGEHEDPLLCSCRRASARSSRSRGGASRRAVLDVLAAGDPRALGGRVARRGADRCRRASAGSIDRRAGARGRRTALPTINRKESSDRVVRCCLYGGRRLHSSDRRSARSRSSIAASAPRRRPEDHLGDRPLADLLAGVRCHHCRARLRRRRAILERPGRVRIRGRDDPPGPRPDRWRAAGWRISGRELEGGGGGHRLLSRACQPATLGLGLLVHRNGHGFARGETRRPEAGSRGGGGRFLRRRRGSSLAMRWPLIQVPFFALEVDEDAAVGLAAELGVVAARVEVVVGVEDDVVVRARGRASRRLCRASLHVAGVLAERVHRDAASSRLRQRIPQEIGGAHRDAVGRGVEDGRLADRRALCSYRRRCARRGGRRRARTG